MTKYIPNPIHFKKKRFLSKGKHDLNKMKLIKVPYISVPLKKGALVLHFNKALNESQLVLFSKNELNKYLIKKEDGKNS